MENNNGLKRWSELEIQDINTDCLYRHEPRIRYSKHADDIYWCQNWTFRPFKYNGKLYMRDTYWPSGDGMTIEITEDNVNEFELIFNYKDVEKVNYEHIEEFGEKDKDWFVLPVDSGGRYSPKSFIRKGAKRNKNMVIVRKEQEIKELENKINDIQFYINRIKSNEIEPRDWE